MNELIATILKLIAEWLRGSPQAIPIPPVEVAEPLPIPEIPGISVPAP